MVARAEDVIPHRSPLWAFITRWLLTTNHKEIGTLYLWLSFVLFFIAGAMAMVIRLELFQPGIAKNFGQRPMDLNVGKSNRRREASFIAGHGDDADPIYELSTKCIVAY